VTEQPLGAVVDPGRTIIKTVTTTHSRLKMPVVIASRVTVLPAKAARWSGRMITTSTTAATAVRAIDTSTQACVSTPIEVAVATPSRGTATPITA
jgi:hypothetical protein